jgi:hypothetical protein
MRHAGLRAPSQPRRNTSGSETHAERLDTALTTRASPDDLRVDLSMQPLSAADMTTPVGAALSFSDLPVAAQERQTRVEGHRQSEEILPVGFAYDECGAG